MRLTLRTLIVSLKQTSVTIPFADVSYFHGQMGAGKTSIARLVDYCLGGSLDPSPALQSEFVSAELNIELDLASLSIERPQGSDRVIAKWKDAEGYHQLSLPARKPAGIVLPNTDVENLSDLIFHLSGVRPPKVATSKIRIDSDLRRLSLRDLLWYCYLDQDELDSTFFHLDKPNDFKQFKSRDVLRFVLEFHNEHVTEIEAEMERLRGERAALLSSVAGFKKVLTEIGVESEGDLLLRIEEIRGRADQLQQSLIQSRNTSAENTEYPIHVADELRARARSLGIEIATLDVTNVEIIAVLERELEHLGEIETLTLKFRRSNSARAVLQGVKFGQCPRCTQPLPERPVALCAVCGQQDDVALPDPAEDLLIEGDAKGRIDELREVIKKRRAALSEIVRLRENVATQKKWVEHELSDVSREYDSVYLARALTGERERAALLQEALGLESMLRFPRLVEEQGKQIERLAGRESTLRADLRAARVKAEQSTSNLDRLKEFFLDCLVRTGFPGISAHDTVKIDSKDFLPTVRGPNALESTVTSFSNMSSGGKKTLFKCCFAVALHRLAKEVGARLPELLMIDSPMKNISERENKLQFENFHNMLYDLCADELSETQLVLIDKEYYPPPATLHVDTYERHMQPNQPGVDNPFPPLIPYYTGH